MSAVAEKVQAIGKAKKREVEPGQMFLYGKINACEKFKSKKEKRDLYRTRVLMKDASDEFAYPMPYDVISEEPLGALGEIFEGIVMAKTFRADWTTRPDQETGETKKISKVELTCYAVA
jgi:hypothetical protein